MDREANYVAVGVFVLLVLFMGIGFVLWYSNAANGEAATRYEIYFEGSVGGLSEGSAVRYLGVAVGRVVKIGIDPRDPGRVRVVTDIDEGAPVKEDTVARLSLQGVTGLLTINLEPREPGSIPPPRIESLKFPVIPSEQSRFDVLITSLPDVIAKAGESLNRINAMLSDENIAAVTKSFEYTEDATSDLPMTINEARAMFLELRAASGEISAAAQGLRDFAGPGGADLKAAAARMREASESVARSAARIDQLVQDNSGNVGRFTSEGLAELEQLMRETREAVQSFDALTRSLEQDPSRVIYRPAPAGVEIPP